MGSRLSQGEPILELTLPGLNRVMVRCQTCAGEPVNLSAEAIAQPRSVRAEVMSRLAEIMPDRFGADWKIKQSGSDE